MEPWKHFIPVRSDLRDLKEKYMWAQNNTLQAKAISQQATALVKTFSTDYGTMFEEFFQQPLHRVVNAYTPLTNGSLQEAIRGEFYPILSCGGYDDDDCEDLVVNDQPNALQQSPSASLTSNVNSLIQDTATRRDKALQLDAPPLVESWLLSSSDHPAPYDGNGIPRIINKIFFGKDGQFQGSIDGNLKRAHDSWKDMNSGYQVRYFDLTATRQYLHQFFHPVFLRTLDCIQAFANKADFARIVLLYREGGWYSDFKQVVLQKNLLDTISSGTNFWAAIDEEGPERKFKCLQNAFIGAKPRHPILEEYLKLMMKNVQSRHYGK